MSHVPMIILSRLFTFDRRIRILRPPGEAEVPWTDFFQGVALVLHLLSHDPPSAAHLSSLAVFQLSASRLDMLHLSVPRHLFYCLLHPTYSTQHCRLSLISSVEDPRQWR